MAVTRERVMLTNAEERSMLAASRSLREAGYEVRGASFSRFAATRWSRSCSGGVRIADSREDSNRFVEQLRSELTARPHGVLIPGSDGALLAISRGRERLQDLTRIGLPSKEIVERSLERESLSRAASAAGLTAVRSIRCTSVEEASAAVRELGFPVVLKSIETALARGDAIESAPKGMIVSTETQLRKAAERFGDGLLVQRHIQGGLVSFGGVYAGGRLLGTAVSRYARTWPVAAGSVTFSETIPPPSGLAERVSLLLGRLGWEGIFELELIDSDLDGPVPIDLNPRPYGSMALAGAAGAPLAAIWCDWLLGSDPTPAVARAGVRYRWEDGELRHLAWQAGHGHLAGTLRPLLPRRHVTHANFRLNDPLPLLAQGAYLVGKGLAR